MVFVLTIVAFLLDRLSKWWMTANVAQGESVQIHELLTLQATYNRGMVFGLFQGTGGWMGWISVLVIGVLALYLARLPKGASMMRLGLALVIGGALGNVVDRLQFGQVLDFISTPLLPWVFNIADIFINGGIALFATASIFYGPNEARPHEKEKDVAPDSPTTLTGGQEIGYEGGRSLLKHDEDEDGGEENEDHEQGDNVELGVGKPGGD